MKHILTIVAILTLFACATGPEQTMMKTVVGIDQSVDTAMKAWADHWVMKAQNVETLFQSGNNVQAETLQVELVAERTRVNDLMKKYNEAKASYAAAWQVYKTTRDAGGRADATPLDIALASVEQSGELIVNIIAQIIQ